MHKVKPFQTVHDIPILSCLAWNEITVKKYTLIAWEASLNFCFDISTQIPLNEIVCLLPKPVLFKL